MDRTFEERDVDFETRNKNEKDFFKGGAWKTIPFGSRCAGALRTHVGDLMYDMLKKGLPQILSEVNARCRETIDQLELLGEERATADEQRRLLTSISYDYSEIVKNANQGLFAGPFFRKYDAENDDGDSDAIFLRSTVARHQEDFTLQMELYGSKYHLCDSEAVTMQMRPVATQLSKAYQAARNSQIRILRLNYNEMARAEYLKKRGMDLPGSSPSWLVTSLFHDMSEPWEKLAADHLMIIDQLCCKLVKTAIEAVAPEDVAKNVWKHVDSVLTERFANAYRELKKLVDNKNESLSIYDPYFAASVKQVQKDRDNRTGFSLDDNNMSTAKDSIDRMEAAYKVCLSSCRTESKPLTCYHRAAGTSSPRTSRS